MIEVLDCSMAYDGSAVLKRISCRIHKGEMYGIIGPNGSGKSTLLRAMSGLEKPASGFIRVDGREASGYPRKKLARFMAVLEQDSLPPVGFTVREVVEMGRYPHQDWLGRERIKTNRALLTVPTGESGQTPGREDARLLHGGADGLIDSVMERLGLTGLADRTLDQVSGGERQRAALGKAMAQDPSLLLLDEPTTYLDIGFQLQMMDFVKQWNKEGGLTVVAVLHDLNLAAQYCDRLLVIKNGQAVAEGTPWDIIQEDLIAEVYGTRPAIVAHPHTGAPQILLQPGEGMS